jgi:hypothetical protein
MSDRRKRYCAKCRSRLRRSALRCPYCGSYSLRGWSYAPVALLCVVVVALLVAVALIRAGR